MSPMLQVKVLRVLQDRRYRRVGGTDEIEADIRIIAATNRDLAKMVTDGQFREDLFYRINVIPVRMPPLRERTGDIPQLAEHFVAKFAPQMKKDIAGITPAAMALSRELPVAGQRPRAGERHGAGGGARAHAGDPGREPARFGQGRGAVGLGAGRQCRVLQRRSPNTDSIWNSTCRISSANTSRKRCADPNGVKVKAAELLGMSFRSFRYYMKKYNLG